MSAYELANDDSEGESPLTSFGTILQSLNPGVLLRFSAASSAHQTLFEGAMRVSSPTYNAKLYAGKKEIVDFLVNVADHASKIHADSSAAYTYEDEPDSSLHSETGDDHVAFGTQPVLFMAESVVVGEIYGVECSIPDTFLSRSVCNYAEKYLMMPGSRFETYGYYVRNRGPRTPFMDIPTLRVVLPVARQKGTHSDSIEGKCSLMARTQAYTEDQGALRWTSECASIMQDCCLGVMTYGKFPYFPDSLGGLGKPVPFRIKENLNRAVYRYKRGRYAPLLTTIMQRSYWMMYPSEDTPMGFQRDPFLEKVKNLFQGWQPWFTNYLRHTPTFSGSIPSTLLKYHVSTYGTDYMQDLAVRRLQAEGRIVTENQLLIASETQEQFKLLLSSDSVVDFMKKKKDREDQFRTETVFSNAFGVLWNTEVEADVFSRAEDAAVEMFANFSLKSTNEVRNFLRHSQTFWAEALDEIYLKGPLRVNFSLVSQGGVSVSRSSANRPKSETTREAALAQLEEWTRGERKDLPPAEMLEDDPIIIESIRRSLPKLRLEPLPAVILVTGDTEMCRVINEQMGVVVFRLPPRLVESRIRALNRRDIVELFKKQLITTYSFVSPNIRVIEDTGSVDAMHIMYASTLFTRDLQFKRSSLFSPQRSLENPAKAASIRETVNWPIGYDYVFDVNGAIVRRRVQRRPSVGQVLARTHSATGAIFRRFSGSAKR